ncbi:DNA-directed RNA polymerase III subunit RPC11 [Guillardia theta CCMP2712]|uniref:DNA-directed RNA polymerase subunit n=2 Tax=Guillardia theta TaxID=55529 RepID=L1IRK5_GUITC|nr:DNA-directed RNA polymerase III subunit RPC11 [Guillardia theta CCMP2712]EKX38722.1 DNA-directed RNA polymerase III subunit RPC11 [Guillardia theta CCMP2712]|mmetsp:Transcript_31274/g.100324  ORF Transcript_31274/g.100324 Transcript_31274/m.100324 type:complete len:110 (+) Transcript_31274:119-448(+)|eukprot:XP_005825702.1 DNA-directed RNA polymerase III subunit RPC11 [Guillardia theta CCMP2712]
MFCPYCANLLVVEPASQGMRFACKTCPYEHKILKKIKKTTPLEQKKVDDVLGDSFANASMTDVIGGCPKCGHPKAYFFSIQIRSADEPATRFYRCARGAECTYTWKEDN